MLIVPNALVGPALRLIRANRAFVSEAGARRRIRERTLRPVPYGPPATLRPDVRVDVERFGDWPVYTVSPTKRASAGGVVYAHGGGWVGEIAPQHWVLAATIAAETGATVSLPIYPLVPYGTAAEARTGMVELVRRSLDRHGPTVLAGDSAGGQIALSAALRLRDDGIVLPMTTLLSPALDLTWSNPRIPLVQPSDPWLATPGGRVFAEHWRGDLELTEPAVSPLFGELAGLGPITLLSGTRDVLNPDAELLVARARAAGVSLDFHEGVGQFHVWALLPTRSGQAATQTIVRSVARGLR
ncbi:alpha/beta hydrolase fold domain-containing protein [Plantibacter sp. ME-Dv--P-095]|uniref:alpha/beta hydrolase fold domain-containing protein n=1 Tax=Plantibacter sp. ME-Dv--P-095 TaxID=3040299 RepID=UPI00254E75B8|nr:alpha/beta hydrolase fold domain-containing protein [Plantibacter sp. ME-Dv--P-095]